MRGTRSGPGEKGQVFGGGRDGVVASGAETRRGEARSGEARSGEACRGTSERGVAGREAGGVLDGDWLKGESGKVAEGMRHEEHVQWVGGEHFPEPVHLRWW